MTWRLVVLAACGIAVAGCAAEDSRPSASVAAAPTSAAAAPTSAAATPAERCDHLYQLTDAHQAVQPGILVEATADTPAHCRVRGVIDRTIRFEVALPVDGWQGRLMFHALGGTAGMLGDTTSLLDDGFAMASTDTGHAGNGQGSEFARDQHALTNFGFRAIHLTTVLSKRIIRQFYGREVDYSYIWGCSNGGRAALVEALRYPDDFDGVIAGAPASGWGREIVPFGVAAGRKQAQGPLTLESLDLLDANSRAACDLLDGLEDGIIGTPWDCTTDVLALDKLLCSDGQTAECLTARQIETARFIYEGLTDEAGNVVIPGVPPGAESDGDWTLWVTGNPAFMPVPGYEGMGGIIENVWHDVPGFNIDAFDPMNDRHALAESTVAVELPPGDFTRFRESGGKLIIYNGWNDAPCRPQVLLDYMAAAEELSGGAAKMAEFHRLYMIPGMLHCAAGPGAWATDYFEAIVAWVEEGRAPERLLATQPGVTDWFEALAVIGNTLSWYQAAMRAGAAKPDAHRFTRPICPHPQYAQYNGSGDPDDAANFSCVTD